MFLNASNLPSCIEIPDFLLILVTKFDDKLLVAIFWTSTSEKLLTVFDQNPHVINIGDSDCSVKGLKIELEDNRTIIRTRTNG